MNADESKSKKRVPIISGGWIGVVVIVMGVLVWWCWPERHEPLNASEWRAIAQSRQYKVRWPMIDDVRRRIDSGEIGDRKTMLAVLGSPETGIDSKMWLYCLGPEHGALFKVDSDWLEITLDEQGKVISHRVRPD